MKKEQIKKFMKVSEKYLKLDASQYESHDTKIYNFTVESNNIEGIYGENKHLTHAAAIEKLLKLEEIKIADIQEFVAAIEPDAFLRTTNKHKVWIAGREGADGAKVIYLLNDLLNAMKQGQLSPNEVHKKYEFIHPFMDGNGRSGRALWLWDMINRKNYDLRYKFLQMYYYETLSEGD